MNECDFPDEPSKKDIANLKALTTFWLDMQMGDEIRNVALQRKPRSEPTCGQRRQIFYRATMEVKLFINLIVTLDKVVSGPKTIVNLRKAGREKYRQTLDDTHSLTNISLNVAHPLTLHHERRTYG